MASTTTTPPTDTPSMARPSPLEQSSIPWRVIVPIVLIGAIVLLMALPLGAVWIVSNAGCCVFDAMENVATFWGSLTAGFLALFGMLIAGVYVITTFRTDAMARAEAHNAAASYITHEKKGFDDDLEKFQREVRAGKERVEREREAATYKIRRDIKSVEDTAKEASDSVVSKLQDVEDQRTDAVQKIDAARDAAEAAAEAAIERINEAARNVPPTTPPEGGRE